jgi:hypothetical protein
MDVVNVSKIESINIFTKKQVTGWLGTKVIVLYNAIMSQLD